MVTPVFPP